MKPEIVTRYEKAKKRYKRLKLLRLQTFQKISCLIYIRMLMSSLKDLAAGYRKRKKRPLFYDIRLQKKM